MKKEDRLRIKRFRHEQKRKKERELMRKLKPTDWEKRKEAIQKRVAKQQSEAHERALKRKNER